MATPTNTRPEVLATIHFALNPESGLSKARHLPTGHTFERHAVDVRNHPDWELVDRATPSVEEQLEAMGQPELVALLNPNGEVPMVGNAGTTATTNASKAALVKEITDRVFAGAIILPTGEA